MVHEHEGRPYADDGDSQAGMLGSGLPSLLEPFAMAFAAAAAASQSTLASCFNDSVILHLQTTVTG